MQMRPYDPTRDHEDCLRIYGEIGWASSSENERRAAALHQEIGRTLVAEVDGGVECFASNQDARLRYLDQDLPACIVAGVGTGRVARRKGLAKRLTAEALALDVIEKDAAVAVLGMFDQGFYDQIGFGTGAPDKLVSFDPGDLRVPTPTGTPVRLGVDDWERMHANRVASLRGHGGVALEHPANTHSELLIHKNGFGFGFEEEPDGALRHHVWMTTDAVRQGPYAVRWMAYRDREGLLELLGFLGSMADQIHCVFWVEPWEIQVWDLLDRPWRRRMLSVGSKHETITRAHPWWQARICNLEACLDAVRLPMREHLRFNLELTDPIAPLLTPETAARWSGVGGTYVVEIGSASGVEARAPDPALPTLSTSVNTFSRLWLGALPASGLAVTAGDLDAPDTLLAQLDRVLCLPTPFLGWEI
ncbi:MAG: sterol carrier protein domain-containing protein [Planctomycetota bacterium]|nr:sterol carrier protein domain-containing protein [Planctomycetota bacterium]